MGPPRLFGKGPGPGLALRLLKHEMGPFHALFGPSYSLDFEAQNGPRCEHRKLEFRFLVLFFVFCRIWAPLKI